WRAESAHGAGERGQSSELRIARRLRSGQAGRAQAGEEECGGSCGRNAESENSASYAAPRAIGSESATLYRDADAKSATTSETRRPAMSNGSQTEWRER